MGFIQKRGGIDCEGFRSMFLPDGTRVATWSEFDRGVKIWDAENGNQNLETVNYSFVTPGFALDGQTT
jgi:hypothetical protein